MTSVMQVSIYMNISTSVPVLVLCNIRSQCQNLLNLTYQSTLVYLIIVQDGINMWIEKNPKIKKRTVRQRRLEFFKDY